MSHVKTRAALNSLPLELIIHIVSFLPRWVNDNNQNLTSADAPGAKRVFPRIVTVSRAFQFAVERIVFRALRVEHTELGRFMFLFSRAHRRFLLKELDFEIVLPTYSDAACAVRESDQDMMVNDRVVSVAVVNLLGIIASWRCTPASSVYLYLYVYSPMDGERRGHVKLRRDSAACRDGRHVDLFGRRYRYSYLQLSGLDKVPDVPALAAIFPDRGSRGFHPCSTLALSTRARHESMYWAYTEPGADVALRRIMRNELVQTLEGFRLPPWTRDMHIFITSRSYKHSYQRLPDLVFPHQHDPLSSALHRMVGNKVESLSYSGPVDPSFFWPYTEAGEPREPFWTSLHHLDVTFDLASPSGRWYFCEPPDLWPKPPSPDPAANTDPGSDPEEDTTHPQDNRMALVDYEHRFLFDRVFDESRFMPDNEVFCPLIEAFARAVAQIPTIEQAVSQTKFLQPLEMFFVLYSAPGIEAYWGKYMRDDSALTRPRVFLCTDDWVVPGPVLAMLRRMSRASHGQDAIIQDLSPITWRQPIDARRRTCWKSRDDYVSDNYHGTPWRLAPDDEAWSLSGRLGVCKVTLLPLLDPQLGACQIVKSGCWDAPLKLGAKA